ncbi:unnamed protein product, partial [Polarella glacialis]
GTCGFRARTEPDVEVHDDSHSKGGCLPPPPGRARERAAGAPRGVGRAERARGGCPSGRVGMQEASRRDPGLEGAASGRRGRAAAPAGGAPALRPGRRSPSECGGSSVGSRP